MATIELNKENFNPTIEDNPIVILDFWAEWCAPCRAFGPTFEAASEAHPDIVFGKINTEEHGEIAQAFNIRSIPTLMVFRDQIVLYSQAGALPAQQLEQLIAQVRMLDMDKVRADIERQSGEAAS